MRLALLFSLALPLSLVACGDPEIDDGEDVDTDPDPDTDADTDTDTDPPGDTTAPSLPGASGSDYVLTYEDGALVVYWRPATDDTTPTEDLEYRVTCQSGSGADTVALDWTAGAEVQADGSGRFVVDACTGASGTYSVWVEVRDEAGNTASWPTLSGSMPSDRQAPIPLDTSHPDYTVFGEKGVLNIYWRDAYDDVTPPEALEYEVVCFRDGLAEVTMSWTRASALRTEASSRYVTGACYGPAGTTQAYVRVRDQAGNSSDYPLLTGAIR